jgi:hypothetical protein
MELIFFSDQISPAENLILFSWATFVFKGVSSGNEIIISWMFGPNGRL